MPRMILAQFESFIDIITMNDGRFNEFVEKLLDNKSFAKTKPVGHNFFLKLNRNRRLRGDRTFTPAQYESLVDAIRKEQEYFAGLNLVRVSKPVVLSENDWSAPSEDDEYYDKLAAADSVE